MFSSASPRHLQFPPELREPVTVADDDGGDDDDAPLANIPRQHAGVYMCLLQHYTPNVPVCSSSPPTHTQTFPRLLTGAVADVATPLLPTSKGRGRVTERGGPPEKQKTKYRLPLEFLGNKACSGLTPDHTGANGMRGRTITHTYGCVRSGRTDDLTAKGRPPGSSAT